MCHIIRLKRIPDAEAGLWQGLSMIMQKANDSQYFQVVVIGDTTF